MSYPQLDFPQTTLTPNSFVHKKRSTVIQNTIPYQLQVLKTTGTYTAFKLQWRDSYSPNPTSWPLPADFHVFWDSDVGKWIEGACYSLHDRKDAQIEAAIHELVEMMRTAQREDGYLNIHFTVVEPEKRFTDLRDMHELYNAGHLIEAAIAHHGLFGDLRFLSIMLKYVDLLCETFGPRPEQKHGYPGHPEIELALLRLHAVTGDAKHLALARYFIDERGNPRGVEGKYHYYDWEAERRGERLFERPAYFPVRRAYWYQQAHVPIVEQTSVQGHSVRSMYLLTGVADLQRWKVQGGDSEGGQDYSATLKRLWGNLVAKKMYLTGGVGAMDQWEGFGIDYFLPQSTEEGGCYAETCAAIGVMMLAQRMLQLDLDGQYADIMELCFYNAVLSGMSSDGKKFSYTNQLASCDAEGSLSERKPWFSCACCPPNVSRLLASIGGYLWSYRYVKESKEVAISVNMFASAVLSFEVGGGGERERERVGLSQTSNWPWDGEIKFNLTAPDAVSVAIDVRIPGWSSDWKITPAPESTKLNQGYLSLSASWLKSNPEFTLNIPLQHRFLSPHPFTNQNVVALARGPIIYCVEDVDNPWVEDHFNTLLFNPSTAIITETRKSDKETGESYVALTADGAACSFLNVSETAGPAVSTQSVKADDEGSVKELNFVPYYYRANRKGRGQMRVGLRKRW